MRKAIKGFAITVLSFGWAFLIMSFTMPDELLQIETAITRVFRDYSVPYEQKDGLIRIEDELVPLAGPSAVSMVDYNGWLRVSGGQLVNEKNEPIQLRGMSSHGLAWYPEYTSLSSIQTTKDYGANLFRAAMYVDDDSGNYTRDEADQAKNRDAMYTAIDNALSLDMYVIADWHIREDGNPLNRMDDAIEFFDALSQRYADQPGLLYEISSDPNGDTTWDDLYKYADMLIPVIRKNSPDAIIIAGTLNHSADLTATLGKPIPYENVMYAYHYNSGIHTNTYKPMLEAAIKAKIPLMTTWALGGGDTPLAQAEKYAMDFVTFVQDNNISWASWSLANKDESFSAIRADVDMLSGWTPDDLTTSGKIAFAAFQN